MKRIITKPQVSDMGYGRGYIEDADKHTLEQVLKWYAENNRARGTVTIIDREGDIVRKFDFNTYDKDIFFHRCSEWVYCSIVKRAEFTYCYMSEDIYIFLN